MTKFKFKDQQDPEDPSDYHQGIGMGCTLGALITLLTMSFPILWLLEHQK